MLQRAMQAHMHSQALQAAMGHIAGMAHGSPQYPIQAPASSPNAPHTSPVRTNGTDSPRPPSTQSDNSITPAPTVNSGGLPNPLLAGNNTIANFLANHQMDPNSINFMRARFLVSNSTSFTAVC